MKIKIITLGCKVNQYESEKIKENLIKNNFEITNDTSAADAVLINSCAVTNMAIKKVRYDISLSRRKNAGAKIFVLGCGADEISKNSSLGQVVVLNKENADKLLNLLTEMRLNAQNRAVATPQGKFEQNHTRNRYFIKVQDGCNNFCSYCIVPFARGREKSVPIADVLTEISALPETIKEVVLTGINLSNYGLDIGSSLAELCAEVDKLGRKFRLSSLEQHIITPKFLSELTRLKNFQPSFHLCLQSGSDKTLREMNRHYTAAEFIAKTKLIREAFKNATISTDIIVGFPTETDADFRETLAVAEKVKFAHIHIFPYSVRSGTVAEKFKQLTPSVITARVRELTEIANKIETEILSAHVGKTLTCLIENKNQSGYIGTSAENFDVIIKSETPLELDFYAAKIIGVSWKKLIGEVKNA
ncbi:MAG: MiaB/RimO family radical SAM methylthiotransferase [Christensenellaceae bacterium]|jgi:threonylcarbamoyladenosine tRNA methylthiotransferase MtaB|nr:MiaB/RimO family radical SAM methylthiotransferase [Christensenellaceae bacterium]